jgi:hypothetical protein
MEDEVAALVSFDLITTQMARSPWRVSSRSLTMVQECARPVVRGLLFYLLYRY